MRLLEQEPIVALAFPRRGFSQVTLMLLCDGLLVEPVNTLL
jgi:hypothetical protein